MKKTLLLFVFCVLTGLLTGCSSLGATDAQKFLQAINNGDLQTANRYVCKDKQDTLIHDLKQASVIAKGEDVMGLKSPGIKDVSCQEKDGVISCTFIAPSLVCSGLTLNDLANNTSITCTSFDPNGAEKNISFEVSDGKFCGFK